MGVDESDGEQSGGGDEWAGSPDPARDDDRVRAAWRSWLSALATDAEAALAAAMAYESLSCEGRDAWLSALEDDWPFMAVPAVALYAPLLAVEHDGPRRAQIEAAIVADVGRVENLDEVRAFRGVGRDGTHVCILVVPLYLEFVRVLSCRYRPSAGFLSVRDDPLRSLRDLPTSPDVDGVAVEPTPLRIVVDELAHAILADRRERRDAPAALASLAHLFGPRFDDVTTSKML
jgi:hypothetical protein